MIRDVSPMHVSPDENIAVGVEKIKANKRVYKI